MLIQIYEIQTPVEASEISQMGVDHVGVLVGKGEFPREIAIKSARKILDAIKKPAKKLVLSLSADLSWIFEIACELNPDLLHLGTLMEKLSPQDLITLKRKFPHVTLMRSIPVTGPDSVEIAKLYEGTVDFLLLDSHLPGDNQIGATGIVHDWLVSKTIVKTVSTPVILAGGLSPANVGEAIRRVRPAGVDSKTQTDQPNSHRKDFIKIQQFVSEVRRAAR